MPKREASLNFCMSSYLYFRKGKIEDKNLTRNDIKRSLTKLCSYYFPRIEFDSLQNIRLKYEDRNGPNFKESELKTVQEQEGVSNTN